MHRGREGGAGRKCTEGMPSVFRLAQGQSQGQALFNCVGFQPATAAAARSPFRSQSLNNFAHALAFAWRSVNRCMRWLLILRRALTAPHVCARCRTKRWRAAMAGLLSLPLTLTSHCACTVVAASCCDVVASLFVLARTETSGPVSTQAILGECSAGSVGIVRNLCIELRACFFVSCAAPNACGRARR